MADTRKIPRKPFPAECSHCVTTRIFYGRDFEEAALQMAHYGWRVLPEEAFHCPTCDRRLREKGCEHLPAATPTDGSAMPSKGVRTRPARRPPDRS